jgi:SAM-dependent methyltransferase
VPDRPAAAFALAPDVAAWLLSDAGLGRLAAATGALDQGSDELVVAARLRADGLAPARARAVLDAAQARRRARGEHGDADRLVLTTSALEQASHPAAAAARAARYAAAGAPHVIDLCSGVGGDALALAAAVGAVTAVDRDAGRLLLLAHNAAVRGLRVETRTADALAFPLSDRSWVHADPGRRSDGRRLRRLADYLPPVPALVGHAAGTAGTGVVVSPAVDLDDPGLPAGAELEFVQSGRRLLEASVWLGGLRTPGAVARATLLEGRDGATLATVTRDGPPVALPLGPLGGVLLEPAPAAVRARLHGRLGAQFGARRVAARRALLTSDAVPDSPWFTPWEVAAVLPLRAREVRRWLRDHGGAAPVELATHGVDADPETWWRRLGRPPRGPGGLRLHLVRLDEGAACVVGRPPG